MKTIFLVLSLGLLIENLLFTQKLSDLYKKEIINLEPVADFGSKNNWDTLFRDYKAFNYGKPIGQMKKIVIAPDGSLFMSHKTRHEIWKFDKNGNFVLKFGKQGGKPGQFVYLPTVEGIFEGKYIYTNDVQGRMNFFDFNGKFIKMLKLDYVPLETVPLRDGKIAILGFVVGKNNVHIVRLKDFLTGTEKQIWTESENMNENTEIKVKYTKDKPSDNKITISYPDGGMMSCSLPYTHASLTWPRLAVLKNGNLILASPKTGKIIEYSPIGQLVHAFQLNIEPLKVTEEDIQKSYENAIKGADEFEKRFKVSARGKKMTEQEQASLIKSYREQLVKFKDRDLYPKQLPYFSSMIIDSDGNILVFEFTKYDDQLNNRFRAYSYDMKGNFLGTSSFKNEALDLTFNSQNFQFFNGFVYTVAKAKVGEKVPLRIVKLKPQL
jgi:hypothetical protein